MSDEYKVEEGLFYTKEHEWAKKLDDGNVAVGIADYAQAQLHEVVYVELPDVDSEVEQMEAVGAVESVKAVSDFYCPVGGKVIEVNESLIDAPEKINDDPYGEGWIAKVEPSNLDDDLGELMDAKAYGEYLKTLSH
ncbi:glycine cleavage system protein GcvH [Candidatus Bathyarchaeota archaeon]|nr:glycine cleavage system protein GcvH [Candidatus Bathyarchaeota archaeon]